ncbi:type I-E CRISPR-associated protein Cse2/CasB [Streptomyces sp. HPF1205]|uniref:type I-E CRISPR-associated protein Cse2/CasB n=1 Tax=Streptomyces sp. HPF1205 TaxID=2873262 RepID=UPI001CEC9225|nr:type I-E CRISPR-associated protein Cse2/CasB [Streptomyces sp. HPF1205]
MTLSVLSQPPDAAAPPSRHDSMNPYDAFVAGVLRLCSDAGTQQALRRALGRSLADIPARTHAALLRGGLVPDGAGPERRRAYYAVAALIAARPRAQRIAEADGSGKGAAAAADDSATPAGDSDESVAGSRFRPRGTSLGEGLASAVARQGGTGGIKQDGAESRLHLMVRQDVDGLHRMLPAVLRQVASAGVAADYACLLRDLIAWPKGRDAVSVRWLEDYYRTLRRHAAEDKTGEPPAAD